MLTVAESYEALPVAGMVAEVRCQRRGSFCWRRGHTAFGWR